MTRTLSGADIRGYHAALGIQLSGWARTEASVRCFADPDAHLRADRDPSCSVNLEHGAARQVSAGKHRDDLPSWALSPLAVERIRPVMLERLEQGSSLLALRDATAVSVQCGLGMRNQEIWALTLGDLAGRRATVREVLSYGALDAGKTEGATGRARRPPIDALRADDISVWATALAANGIRPGGATSAGTVRPTAT
jgi:integrase